jgi:hypothetical protein
MDASRAEIAYAGGSRLSVPAECGADSRFMTGLKSSKIAK